VAERQITLCQRSPKGKGSRLGKTTGWIHRASLQKRGVSVLCEVSYEKVDEAGLHLRVAGKPTVLAVDTVIVCAGQEPLRELVAPLRAAGKTVHQIGGADEATELDARRAIAQGSQVAAEL
jgi:2,4-dienoyl-CoA reductase (NADPH2)